MSEGPPKVCRSSCGGLGPEEHLGGGGPLGALHPRHSLAPSSVSFTMASGGQPSHKSYAAPARLNGQIVTGEEILGRDISGSITF